MINKIKKFWSESLTEIKHVNWPTRNEAIRLTAIVITLALGLSLFLGLFDYIFTFLMKKFVLHII